jgi:putative iron-regulated protein
LQAVFSIKIFHWSKRARPRAQNLECRMLRTVLEVRALSYLGSLPSFARTRERALRMAVGVMLLGCGDDTTADDGQKQAVIRQYADVVRQSYDDAIADAKEMRVAIDALIEKPSVDTLKAAREAWIAARPSYLQTEAYRFYEGPIDDPDDGREGRINAWPLDEAFIDYVVNPRTNQIERKGIINDRDAFSRITDDVLIAQNESGGEENISTGYHAIEFLLWGQDLSATGPGDRPYTDFVGGNMSTDPDSDRRRQYLTVVTDLLIEDLEYTRAAWNDGQPYLKKFFANVKNQSLKNIITGISYLAGEELAAERIRPAYESQDQEDEHSCFSDNTPNDMKYDLLGIENVYLGRYRNDDGAGLENLVKAADPALDAKIKNGIGDAAAALAAVPVPFDQAIKDTVSLRKVRAAIDALDALHDSLSKLNTTLKL